MAEGGVIIIDAAKVDDHLRQRKHAKAMRKSLQDLLQGGDRESQRALRRLGRCSPPYGAYDLALLLRSCGLGAGATPYIFKDCLVVAYGDNLAPLPKKVSWLLQEHFGGIYIQVWT